MNKGLLINAGLLAAILVLGLVAWLKPSSKEPEYRVSTLNAADAHSLQVVTGGTVPITMERLAAEWLITAPFRARAEPLVVQRMLELLDAKSNARFAATGLARYGLSEPQARTRIADQEFAFGSLNDMTREQYVLSGEHVYLLPLRYGAALPKNPLDLVSKQLFGADEAPIAFDFGSFKVEQHDSKWTLTMTSTTVAPAEAGPDEINGWVNDWRLVSALALQGPTQRKPLGALQVMLNNGNVVVIDILERGDNTVITRSDQPFEYAIAATAAQRLLKPPGTTRSASTRPASPFTAK